MCASYASTRACLRAVEGNETPCCKSKDRSWATLSDAGWKSGENGSVSSSMAFVGLASEEVLLMLRRGGVAKDFDIVGGCKKVEGGCA